MNYANPDMVGHTGVVEAGVHACETIDLGVRIIVEKVLELGGKLFITADHGNCEQMRNADGSPTPPTPPTSSTASTSPPMPRTTPSPTANSPTSPRRCSTCSAWRSLRR
jgi:hypothetical protein